MLNGTQSKVQVSLPALHPTQRGIYTHPARFRVLACGRRYGKTTLADYVLAKSAIKARLPYAYFAPTYKMLSEVWRQLKYILSPVTVARSEQEHRLELLGGGVIDCWSLDNPDSSRGRKYAGIVVDEAAMVRNLGDIYSAVLRPLLTDYSGWAMFLSTPKGRNFFWQLYQRGLDPANTDWKSWSYPTTANPHINPLEVEAARQELPDLTFKQEYLAEFLENEGTVFRRIREAATAPRVEPYQGKFVAGLDWAQQEDFTYMVVLDANTKTQVDQIRFNQVDWALQRGRVKAMADKWKIHNIVCELNSIGSPNFEALRREGLPVMGFTTTAVSKPPLIESLVLAFERDEIHIWNDPVLMGELEAYEREVSPVTGRSRYGAPEGLHDDGVMALALAWHGVQTPTTAVQRPNNLWG